MKRFFRTIAGKTILFILCVASIITLIGSGVCLFLMINEDIYTTPEEDILHSRYERIMDSEAVRLTYWGTSVDNNNGKWELVKGHRVPDWGNIIYQITDHKGEIIASSDSSSGVSGWTYSYSTLFTIDHDNSDLVLYSLPPDSVTGTYYDEFGLEQDIDPEQVLTIQMSLKEGLPSNDRFRTEYLIIHAVYILRYAVFAIATAALLILIASFIALMSVSGRKPGSDEIYPGPLNNIPADIMLALYIIAAFLFLRFISVAGFGMEIMIIACIALVAGISIFIGFCMNAAVKIKQRRLLKTTLIYYILKGLWILCKAIGRGITMIPLIWKTVLLIIIISVVELIVVVNFAFHDRIMLWVIEKILIVPFIIYIAISLRQLQKGGQALAEGDLDYKTETKWLIWDLKKHGQNLNSAAEGMNAAVAERTKSERMKTELITNVSHDLKTPLTSIVNYADLISKEPCDNPKITEYSEILVKQSGKMKRLIEDLVEASKATTGNLDITLEPCDACIFLSQAVGEYEEKLTEAGLQLVTKEPKEPIRILADGRRMWRIFDNLMNNIIKYAMPGTRVYLTLERSSDSFAEFSFRNTSRESLDISADELMERFTRGDHSRNTEGNGLGLAIAKSMAELQGGKLDLYIDGDLFKAILRIPCDRLDFPSIRFGCNPYPGEGTVTVIDLD